MRVHVQAGLLAIIAALLASPALAQTAGRWPMVVGEKLCTGEPRHARGGLNWRLNCEAACPSGTSLVTGACRALDTDNQGLALEGFGPTANGWSCDFVSTRHDVDRSAGVSPRTRVKAEAYCRDHAASPAARWTTPASGQLMVIARSGAEIGEKIRFGIRICNTDGPLPVNVHLLLRDPEKPGVPERPDARSLPVGSCLQVEGPVAVFVQNGATQNHGLSGTYQLYREGSFKSVPEIKTAAELAANQRDERALERRIIKPGPAEVVQATCEKLDAPPKGLWGKCPVKEIAEIGNYRLCFGPSYAPPVNTEPNHPGDHLPAALNPKLLSEPLPASYFSGVVGAQDALNPVYANACRDYLNVRDLNFLLLESRIYPPASAKSVWFTLQKLG